MSKSVKVAHRHRQNGSPVMNKYMHTLCWWRVPKDWTTWEWELVGKCSWLEIILEQRIWISANFIFQLSIIYCVDIKIVHTLFLTWKNVYDIYHNYQRSLFIFWRNNNILWGLIQIWVQSYFIASWCFNRNEIWCAKIFFENKNQILFIILQLTTKCVDYPLNHLQIAPK